jgi:hypothetical protein
LPRLVMYVVVHRVLLLVFTVWLDLVDDVVSLMPGYKRLVGTYYGVNYLIRTSRMLAERTRPWLIPFLFWASVGELIVEIASNETSAIFLVN